jgi:hypothetical protein
LPRNINPDLLGDRLLHHHRGRGHYVIADTTAINLARLDAWWTGTPVARTRTTHLARLGFTLAA